MFRWFSGPPTAFGKAGRQSKVVSRSDEWVHVLGTERRLASQFISISEGFEVELK